LTREEFEYRDTDNSPWASLNTPSLKGEVSFTLNSIANHVGGTEIGSFWINTDNIIYI
jgi:hypothetical protein